MESSRQYDGGVGRCMDGRVCTRQKTSVTKEGRYGNGCDKETDHTGRTKSGSQPIQEVEVVGTDGMRR